MSDTRWLPLQPSHPSKAPAFRQGGEHIVAGVLNRVLGVLHRIQGRKPCVDPPATLHHPPPPSNERNIALLKTSDADRPVQWSHLRSKGVLPGTGVEVPCFLG